MGALFDPSEQLREGVWAYFLLSIWQSSQGSYSTRKSAIWLVWLYYFLPLGMELRRFLTCFVSMEVLPYKYPSFVNFSMIFPEQLREGVWAYFLLSIWQSSQGSYSTRKSAIWLVWLYYFLPLGMELRRFLTCFVSMEVLPYKYPSFVNFSMIFPCELWIFHYFFSITFTIKVQDTQQRKVPN